MSDLEELRRKQSEMAKYAQGMANEKDPERLAAMATSMQERARELERAARALEAIHAPKVADGPETRVLLTPDQRARVAADTGVGIEAVSLRDEPGRPWSKTMSRVEPREIERIALQQAARSRLAAETRDQVEKIIGMLEKQDVPELAETIAELRRDPALGLEGKD
jgi:hypothetical protein